MAASRRPHTNKPQLANSSDLLLAITMFVGCHWLSFLFTDRVAQIVSPETFVIWPFKDRVVQPPIWTEENQGWFLTFIMTFPHCPLLPYPLAF